MSHLSDSSSLEDPLDDYTNRIRSKKDFSFPTAARSKNFTMAPSSPADHGLLLFDIHQLTKKASISRTTVFDARVFFSGFGGSGSDQLYISSFHTTPERRRFSKPDWEKFTRDSTDNALEELASSPGFGKWLSRNADRITVTPPSSSRAEQRRKWFVWF